MCGGTYAFQIYAFPASAAPTPAPTTLAPTHAPTPPTGAGALVGSATVSYQDILNAIAGGGDISLILTDSTTTQVVGTLDATVTTARRRQMMEAVDGQQGLRGDSRGLASTTVSICFQSPRVGARRDMAPW